MKATISFKGYTMNNGQGMVIPEEVMKKALLEFQERVKNKVVVGELDHPDDMTISMQDVSLEIRGFKVNEDLTCEIDYEILGTPKGQIARLISSEGVELTLDQRMYGNAEKIDMVTFDLIKKPE